jgi:hypothetical protein
MVPEQNKPELTREPAAESKPESLSSYLNSRSAFSHSQDPQLKSSLNPMSASRQSCPADLVREPTRQVGTEPDRSVMEKPGSSPKPLRPVSVGPSGAVT